MAEFNTRPYLPAKRRLQDPVTKRRFLLPAGHSPDGAPSKEGVQISGLTPGDGLTVRTRNSVYRLVMLNSVEQMVLVRGGRHFPRPVEACLLGSSDGLKIRIGWLAPGRGVSFAVGSRCFITSPVVAIDFDQEAVGSSALMSHRGETEVRSPAP